MRSICSGCCQDKNLLNKNQNKTIDNQSEEAGEKKIEYHGNENIETEEDECTEAEPWILENGVNVTELFAENCQRIEQLNKSEGFILLETHVQELVALNHILILKPLQHSKMMREVFTDENIRHF